MIKDIAMACLLRVVVANTPRDFAESSTPQLIYYGQELPPTVFIFVLVLVYSSIMPIILLFGTIYFFFGYICFKYLLLFGMSIFLNYVILLFFFFLVFSF